MVHWIGAIAAATLVSQSNAAMAADLPPLYDTPVYQDVPELQPVEIGTGWYLRGDVGYQFKSHLPTSYDLYQVTVNGTTTTRNDFSGTSDDVSLANSAIFSGGIGYQFTDYLRADVTGGYWKDHLDAANFPQVNSVVGTDVTAWQVMANAYVDLGTYAGFTPYVGAGAGAVHLAYEASCVYGGSSCGSTYTVNTENSADWRFAYSLMAGVSYDISPNLKFDLGYRFTDVRGAGVTKITGTTANGDALGIAIDDNGFKRHIIQAGLRYSLW
ncbi:porin family protein [Jiella sp. CQZ9-1]|uniref:Porin family protein n=2 Tax=Jiella flava TaxID=2816857 RepID=A0A939JUW4_9HYPH|nr:porin family protein [Jiella flava]